MYNETAKDLTDRGKKGKENGQAVGKNSIFSDTLRICFSYINFIYKYLCTTCKESVIWMLNEKMNEDREFQD